MSDHIARMALAAYLAVGLLTYGHAGREFCRDRKDGWGACVMILTFVPALPLASAAWPLYWSAQAFKPSTEKPAAGT